MDPRPDDGAQHADGLQGGRAGRTGCQTALGGCLFFLQLLVLLEQIDGEFEDTLFIIIEQRQSGPVDAEFFGVVVNQRVAVRHVFARCRLDAGKAGFGVGLFERPFRLIIGAGPFLEMANVWTAGPGPSVAFVDAPSQAWLWWLHPPEDSPAVGQGLELLAQSCYTSSRW